MSDPHYPDDIRKYDSDPRSPFYDSSAEDAKDDWMQTRLDELMKNSAIVNESLDDLDFAYIGQLLNDAMWGNTETEAKKLKEVGKIMMKTLIAYAEKNAETDYELMIEDY